MKRHWKLNRVVGAKSWQREFDGRKAGVMELVPDSEYGLVCMDAEQVGNKKFGTLLEALSFGDNFVEGGFEAYV